MEGKPVNNSSSSSSSWVVEMEKMPAGTDLAAVEMARWKKTSIYRVPEWLKNMTGKEAYRPRLVSLGPFHHGDPVLRPMEEHKRRAVLHIVKRSGKLFSEFKAAIEEVADQLLDAYEDIDEKWRGAINRGKFVDVMVTDACFLLEIMKGLAVQKAPDDYAPNDPVFSVHSMVFLWAGIRADMMVIENQLPLLALHTIEAVWRGTNSLNAKGINKLVLNFMGDPVMEGKFEDVDIDNLCLHPLDVFHKSFCGLRPGHQQEPRGEPRKLEQSMPSALELREVGIRLRKSKTDSIRDIKFKNGMLHLPSFSIHDGTEKIFLNLMAFERLHPDTGSEATAFLVFMDNIIDSERDVQLLRSKGIIKNLLSSDKEASNLFNILSKGVMLSPFNRLNAVRRDVNAHCGKPSNKWRAFFMHAYLRNPCLFISLMAAVILLIANLLQTVYSVMAFYR